MSLKPCFLSQILIDDQDNQFVIFVAERDGIRRIPIVIGPMEAMAIDRAVKGQKFSRPLTHDLFIQVIAAVGLKFTEVRIVDLKEGTFYAQIVMGKEDGSEENDITVDCRPSDALALMVRLPDTPLMVADHVLDEAGNA
jgi:bifunctional DNase/RNase